MLPMMLSPGLVPLQGGATRSMMLSPGLVPPPLNVGRENGVGAGDVASPTMSAYEHERELGGRSAYSKYRV